MELLFQVLTEVLATNTNRTAIYLVTRNASGYHEQYPIGNSIYSIYKDFFFTDNNAHITEAEWFTLTSGGLECTYV